MRGSVLSSQPLILWNIKKKKIVGASGRKKMSRGWGNERRVWAFKSGVRSGGQRDGSEQEIPPLIPPPFFPFPSTWQWTLSKVQIHCHSEWMNEWWHGEVSGHSRFELWLLTNVTPCHLHQPKNLHNAIINPPHASLSSQQLFCLLGGNKC